ncbi:MAG: prepilin-type N-terminal cleavage/methylation domain-containing protein [Vicinamibacteria bacterium]|nr:prepilin-type N-terminal cleavage/methylation domain-containing protein [Vicinamibacteria bacterium]
MKQQGHTLIEMIIILVIVLTLAAISIPNLKAYAIDAYLLGAGRTFKGRFREAHSIAVRSNVQTAIRFELSDTGAHYSIYVDRNHNGVLSRDIDRGVDQRIRGPLPLNGEAPGVWIGIHPNTPAPPPDHGMLDVERPIRFGSSMMISFSPLGTATPGTFYLAGKGGQAAVRVTPGSARVRLMIYRGGHWRIR